MACVGDGIAFACERGLAVAAKPPIRETSPPILRAALQLASPWQSFACANDPAGYLANCVFDVLLAVAVFVAKFPGVLLTDYYDYFFLNFLARSLRAFEGLCLGLKSTLATKQNV